MDSNSTEFLRKKAANFIAYIETLEPDDTARTMISAFNPDMLFITYPLAVAAIRSKSVDAVVGEIRLHTKVDGSNRIRRYLTMFLELS